MSNIRESKDYSKFVPHQFNRNINSTKKLEQSFMKYGWIEAYPLHVVRDGVNFVIKAGNHRFHVAKSLGIPIKFVICDNDRVTIHELEGATTQWSLEDYLNSHERMGKFDYEYLKQYHEKTCFPIGLCIAVCGGQSASSASNFKDRFKQGSYLLGNQDHANDLWNIAGFLKNTGVSFYSNSKFLAALSRCLFVKNFNKQTFKKKSKTYKQLLEKQPNIERYLDMIDTIYNKGVRSENVIPLAFLANQEAKKRSVANINGEK